MVSTHTSSSSSRSCPACGAHNSGLSLFCAECGSGLNDTSWEDDGQTQAFQPTASGDTTSWNTPADSQRRNASGTYPAVDDANETAHVDAPPPYSTFNAGYGSSAVVASWTSTSERGVRGFWLGVMAWLLILAVFCLYLWSAVLSSGLRDDIRNLIPGL